jgi:hypothetical protein
MLCVVVCPFLCRQKKWERITEKIKQGNLKLGYVSEFCLIYLGALCTISTYDIYNILTAPKHQNLLKKGFVSTYLLS